ncbi:hypothetical protein [Streptomyces sp. NPDC058542]|uniref:hypothetical protein n=1 Tax=Streptomyces sp. NPDC058542 TaxID=3346543 RepID=UPI003655FF7A
MTTKLTIQQTSGLEGAANLEIFIPASVWAQLNEGEAWTGFTAEDTVEGINVDVHKVTIRVGG